MTKQQFLDMLKLELSSLPEKEAEKTIEYYSEMIDDLIEDGKSEEEAVSSLESPAAIAQKILGETPINTLIKERKQRRTEATDIILLIFSFPLLIIVGSVLLALYVLVWSVIVSIYAVVIAFAISAIALLGSFFVLIFTNNVLAGLVSFGVSLIMASLTIISYLAAIYISKGLIISTKFIWRKSKSLLFKRAGGSNE